VHFRTGQEKVAKIVQCGEKIKEEAIRKGGLKFFGTILFIERLFLTSGQAVDRGRTASYPTAPAQISACGFPAPGSS
jgi:hypothetical protein